MAVYNVGGGGGLLGTLGKIATLGSAIIPGGQAITPWLAGAQAVGSLANGDVLGAVQAGAPMIKGAIANRSYVPNASLRDALWRANSNIRGY